jgi:hypothetical protein
MRTSFHHQPEAQHPKSSAIHKLGRPITPSFGPDNRGFLTPVLAPFRTHTQTGRYRGNSSVVLPAIG